MKPELPKMGTLKEQADKMSKELAEKFGMLDEVLKATPAAIFILDPRPWQTCVLQESLRIRRQVQKALRAGVRESEAQAKKGKGKGGRGKKAAAEKEKQAERAAPAEEEEMQRELEDEDEQIKEDVRDEEQGKKKKVTKAAGKAVKTKPRPKDEEVLQTPKKKTWRKSSKL